MRIVSKSETQTTSLIAPVMHLIIRVHHSGAIRSHIPGGDTTRVKAFATEQRHREGPVQ